MKKLWRYIKVLITLVVISLFIYYFLNNREDLLFVLSVNPIYLLFIFFFSTLIIFLNGIFIKVILAFFDKTVSTLESFYITTISTIGNYFLPARGGAVIRSVYLKKNFNFPYSHFISTLYGYYILLFLVNSFLALLALGINHYMYGIVSLPLYIFFGLLFFSMLFLTIVKFPVSIEKKSSKKIVKKLLNFIKSMFEGWNLIIEDKGLLGSLLLLTLGNFFSSFLLFYFQFHALSIEANILNLLLYTCLSGVSLLISITPGSLGIREGVFLLFSESIGLSQDRILQLAVLDRGSLFILLIILTLFFTLVVRKFNIIESLKSNEKD